MNAYQQMSEPENLEEIASTLALLKMVTIDRMDVFFTAKPHRVHQKPSRYVAFHNITSTTVELGFGTSPFEESGPYIVADGAFLILKVRSEDDVRGQYSYTIQETSQESPGTDGATTYSADEYAPDQEASEIQTRSLMLRSNPEMIIE